MKVLVLVLGVVAHSRRSCITCSGRKREENHQKGEKKVREEKRKPSNNSAYLGHHWKEAEINRNRFKMVH